jgi:hypothetical protein
VEHLIVYSKFMLTLYFEVHSVVHFKADIGSTIDDVVVNDVGDVNYHTLRAVREEEQASYRYCLTRRADFCEKEAYKH